MTRKKDFRKTPAELFLTTETPEGYKINRRYIETRSQRIQLLIEPSTHEKVVALSDETGLSRNEIYNRAIKTFLERIEYE